MGRGPRARASAPFGIQWVNGRAQIGSWLAHTNVSAPGQHYLQYTHSCSSVWSVRQLTFSTRTTCLSQIGRFPPPTGPRRPLRFPPEHLTHRPRPRSNLHPTSAARPTCLLALHNKGSHGSRGATVGLYSTRLLIHLSTGLLPWALITI